MQAVFSTHRRVADCDQLVSDHQPTISLRRTPIHNLSHIYAIVTRYMLVAYSTSNTEPEAFCALQQLDLQQPDIARTAVSSDILRQNWRIGVQKVSALTALNDLVITSCNSISSCIISYNIYHYYPHKSANIFFNIVLYNKPDLQTEYSLRLTAYTNTPETKTGTNITLYSISLTYSDSYNYKAYKTTVAIAYHSHILCIKLLNSIRVTHILVVPPNAYSIKIHSVIWGQNTVTSVLNGT